MVGNWSRATIVVAALALSGCFAELATSVIPREHQTVTGMTGDTASSTSAAWTIAFWFGFHFDIKGVQLDYAPPWGGGRGTTVSGGDAADFGDDGHHARLAVDVLQRRQGSVAATIGYDSVRALNVDATGVMTSTDPNAPNGERRVAADGALLFGGLTLTNPKRWLAVTFGASYETATSSYDSGPGGGSFDTVPGVDASGVGIQVSITASLPTAWLVELGGLDLKIERAPPGSGGGSRGGGGGDDPLKPSCTTRTIEECTNDSFGRRCNTRTVCD